MKSIILKTGYGLKHVQLQEQEVPQLHAHQVLVKVGAVSLNQLDLMIAGGAFPTSLPHVLGSDAAGSVVAVGSSVSHLKVGDLVCTHFIQNWQSGKLKTEYLNSRLGTTVQGVFSEYLVLPAHSFIRAPAHLTAETAATLPIAALTAWEAIVNAGSLKAGETVLLQGTGGVSVFALQFAKAMGGRVIITSSSEEKLAKARALGADETINYKEEKNWQEKVLALTGGRGVDLALEMSWVGVNNTMQAMQLGGKIMVVGLLGGMSTELSVFGILQKSLHVQGIQVGSMASFEQMNRAIETNRIKPVVDRVFEVQDFAEAFYYFERGRHFGKVVLSF